VIVDCTLGIDGFAAAFGWNGGSQGIGSPGCPGGSLTYTGGINQDISPSDHFGWVVYCTKSSGCSSQAPGGRVLGIGGVQLTVGESASPSITRIGSNNILAEAGHWVRGAGWPAGFTASDPSGICGTDLVANGTFTNVDNAVNAQDTSQFVQCPTPYTPPAATVDTTKQSNGALSLEYAATNAAGNVGTDSATVYVDNSPVSLSLTTPGDSDPSAWVNHAVTVVANPTAGPSGVGSTTCSTNGSSGSTYPSGGIRVDGTGVWTVTCSATNNASDPSGQPASSGPQSVAVHIDETPPSIAFEAANPSDPTAVTVDTSDAQSGVSSGSVEMRPAGGGSWQALPTSLDGQHLLARFDDAALARGAWTIQATSCDAAGNCASTTESVNLPVRLGSTTLGSFTDISDPFLAHVVIKRVRVGWHWVSGRRHGKRVRVKRGGQWKTIRVVETSQRCRHRRIQVGPHRWRDERICPKHQLRLKSRKRIGYGRSTTIHGLLTTAEGVPIASAPVVILTAPDERGGQFTGLATATTAPDGAWKAKVPAGPSRRIAAVYYGAPTILPSVSWMRLTVPASIHIARLWPRQVRWGGTVHIDGYLAGGYLPPPPAGELVRLRIGIRSQYTTYGVKIDVTGNGRFRTNYTFGAGPASIRRDYWFQLQALPQDDYPYAPADSGRAGVSVGG